MAVVVIFQGSCVHEPYEINNAVDKANNRCKHTGDLVYAK